MGSARKSVPLSKYWALMIQLNFIRFFFFLKRKLWNAVNIFYNYFAWNLSECFYFGKNEKFYTKNRIEWNHSQSYLWNQIANAHENRFPIETNQNGFVPDQKSPADRLAFDLVEFKKMRAAPIKSWSIREKNALNKEPMHGNSLSKCVPAFYWVINRSVRPCLIINSKVWWTTKNFSNKSKVSVNTVPISFSFLGIWLQIHFAFEIRLWLNRHLITEYNK